MNILSQFNKLINRQERAVATITVQRGGGVVVGETQGGGTVILKGTMETGKKVWYDRRTSMILGEAPDVSFSEFGV